MQVATASEMRHIDQRTITEYHVPGLLLMENAGLQLLHFIQATYPAWAQYRMAVFTGGGNNGGDGFILARHLWHRQVNVCVYLLTPSTALQGDAQQAYAMAHAYGVPMQHCTTLQAWKQILPELHYSDLLIDAILGTGLSRPATGLFAEVIRTLNTLHKPLLAVDIPSGLTADHGNTEGDFLQATHTVTFSLPKRSFFLHPAAVAVGKLHIADIGIPYQAIMAENIQVSLLEKRTLRSLFPTRHPNAHKGSQGHLLVIAGSVGKSGAGVLASLAALRAGAGLVTLALPESLNIAMEARLTEVMTLPVAETSSGTLAQAALPTLLEFLPQVDAVVLGPGLGTHPETVACVHTLLRHSPVPVVLDADGLNSMRGHTDILQSLAIPLILTPHPGEMARLVESDTATVQAQRLEIARELVARCGIYLILKGAYSVIYAPDGQRWINPTGNPAMATAGTGDVLTGIIGAFVCQGLPPLHAAQAGVYVHGAAGDVVRDQRGDRGLIASDIIEEIPGVIHSLVGGES